MTEAAKHTPGPWTADGHHVATSEYGIGAPYIVAKGKCAKANALLIAAAPDMLAALKELAARLGPRWFLEQNWNAPIAAILKAEGRSDPDMMNLHDETPAAEPCQSLILEFATAILHGDKEHRDWLMEAAAAFNARAPLPPPRGKGID